jgi:hypothetical protein
MTVNPVSTQLKQNAANAPFAMEKQNYLTACAEIDRLQQLVHRVHACVTDPASDDHMIVARMKLILSERAS